MSRLEGIGIKYGLTPDCDFPDFAAYLRWKWRVQICGTCTSERLRLENYAKFSDEVNHLWLTSGRAIRSANDPDVEAKRAEAFEKIGEELKHGWKVDSHKRGDFGTRRRVQFQTRLSWDYRVVTKTVKDWNKVGRLVENNRNRSYRQVAHKEFKIGSDVGGIDRWKLHRLMKGILQK